MPTHTGSKSTSPRLGGSHPHDSSIAPSTDDHSSGSHAKSHDHEREYSDSNEDSSDRDPLEHPRIHAPTHREGTEFDDPSQIPKYFPYNSLTPCTNRWLKKRWDDHAQNKHRERIANIGAAIDNTRPVGFHHKFDAKQQKIKQQRAEEIHQQNLKILQKLSKIAARKNTTFSSPGHQPPFHEKRIRELKSIQEQNLHILRRIIDISTDKRSPYSRTKLLKSADANQSLVARISVYPPPTSPEPGSHSAARPWLSANGTRGHVSELEDNGYDSFEDEQFATKREGHARTKRMGPATGWTVDQLDDAERAYMSRAEEILAKTGRKPTGPSGASAASKSSGKALNPHEYEESKEITRKLPK
ncbi:hypothetical protein HDU93_003971 [Gonapodya sp. JEL0774]|nr:hypothetical protein HDU93_003971 [Gonapodya sp. JEL0774]